MAAFKSSYKCPSSGSNHALDVALEKIALTVQFSDEAKLQDMFLSNTKFSLSAYTQATNFAPFAGVAFNVTPFAPTVTVDPELTVF